MNDPERIHILMRYADGLFPIESTIAEHQAVIRERGAVWIGKLGRPVARRHIDRVNLQCASGVPTYLFLVNKAATGYEAHRGTVVRAGRDLPPDEVPLVPRYYTECGILRKISFWVKLSKIVKLEPGALTELRIASSGMAVPDTLRRSMAAVFIVKEGKGMARY